MLEILSIIIMLIGVLLSKSLKKFEKNCKPYIFIYIFFKLKQLSKIIIINKIKIINFIYTQKFPNLLVLLLI